MLQEPAATDWGFPRAVAGVALLVRYAEAHGVPAARALAGSGLPAERLAPDHMVTAAQELTVIRNLRRTLGEVGADVGRTYRPESFGVFGFALLGSRTVLDAMNVALRFIDLSYAFAIPRAELNDDRVVVTVDGSGLPADVRRFLVERDATAIRTVLDGLVPGGVGARLEIDEGTALLSFGVEELARPLARDHPDAREQAAAICAELVADRRQLTGLGQDVRVLIAQQLPTGATVAGVAAGLGMSERTLRRRLAAEGLRFQQLLDDVRASLATAMLAGAGTLPVEEVALRLGYSGAT
ncbi:MAG TPA: AraC family transcriptional regulator ligand-binding domain-containing protein, partial [Nocardioides sp.]|nr:AraC family transcriptional regulator ligand-binding domain-containing protein [Nocardioides sp.]